MAFFEKALEANVMSTHLLIRANVSKKILLQAHKIATDFESRYSAYKEDSFLNTINQQAGKSPVPCTKEDYRLFKTAIEASEQTYGHFDITIGALSHGVYHFGFANEKKASVQKIDAHKSLVNYKNIVLNTDNIYLKKAHMRLDLGGIGKGYVTKQIALFLEAQGATKLLVDVGGEIITRGKAYTIALSNPFEEGNIAYIKTSKEDMSISTSGSYERFIDKESHHILDHKVGLSNNYYSSMTLLQNGWNIDFLDAYATALFNQELSQSRRMANSLNVAMITIDTHANLSTHNEEKLNLTSLDFQNI